MGCSVAYNIVLFTKADPDHPLVWLDLGVEEVKRLFVIPYGEGRNILIKGVIPIHPDEIDIERVRITLTRQLSRERLPTIVAEGIDEQKDQATPEFRFAVNDGTDVSTQFLSHLGDGRKPDESVSGYPKEKTVFVAYGRDESKYLALFNFIRALGLHPLEWSHASDATKRTAPQTIETVENGLRMAQAMVILLTPDDEARLRENFRKPDDPSFEVDLTGQARQNVIFEAGMAWAIDSRRTILVQMGKVRPISDLAGVGTIQLNNSPESRHKFVYQLKMAGCDVDDRGDNWLKKNVADFERDGISE